MLSERLSALLVTDKSTFLIFAFFQKLKFSILFHVNHPGSTKGHKRDRSDSRVIKFDDTNDADESGVQVE